jgi:hypothetical protein
LGSEAYFVICCGAFMINTLIQNDSLKWAKRSSNKTHIRMFIESWPSTIRIKDREGATS